MQNKDNYNNKNIVKRKKKQKKTNKQIQPIKHLHRTDKALTGERERERERKKNYLFITSKTIKRLPCLICSVNITFIKTKRSICLSVMVPVQFFLP